MRDHAIRRRLGNLTLLMALITPAVAMAEDAYTRIEPRAPRDGVSALAYFEACSGVTCVPNDPAIQQFCTKPLNAPVVPSLDDVINACPGTKSAPPRLGDGLQLGGSAWQDAMVRGLAAFLVERAKAEALSSAAIHFRDGLCSDEQGALLFPLTCTLLKHSDPYNIPLSWSEVKRAAERDLHDLPLHLLALKVPRRTDTLKDAPELLYVMFDISEQVVWEGKKPLELLVGLERYADPSGLDCAARPAACSLLLSGILAEVILPKFDPTKAKQARFQELAARLVIDQAIKDGIIDGKKVPSSAILESVATGVDLFGAAAEALKKAGTLSRTRDAAAIAELVATSGVAVSGLITLGAESGLVPMKRETFDDVVKVADLGRQVIRASLNREYVTASLQALALLDFVGFKVPPKVARYLAMLAELAEANTPDEVKAVLEAFAAPVGSFRGKRGSGKFTLSVNGYVGGQAGWEWLTKGDAPRARSFEFGVFAPVGIEASWGIAGSSSLGFFLSVFDLGAIASFRTSSESSTHGAGSDQYTVKDEPQIGFTQLFAPGGYVVWGLGGGSIGPLPLVVGLGASMTPQLRRTDLLGTGMTESANALRVGAFLAIDVTILPF